MGKLFIVLCKINNSLVENEADLVKVFPSLKVVYFRLSLLKSAMHLKLLVLCAKIAR